MSFLSRVSAALMLSLLLLSSEILGASGQTGQSLTLVPSQVRTVAESRCGSARLATAGTNCLGFDGRQIRDQSDIFVVGFENDSDLAEKHVLQVVAVFDLAAVRGTPGAEVSRATLGYAESSTTRRSAGGESEYGILPSCNTGLGVPAREWDGRTDTLVPTRPAATAGAVPATTGGAGAWDVTPQVQQWLAAGQQQGTLVLRGDDESMDIHQRAMCLSYVIDLGLTVEQYLRP
jgi:hypothetical protein